MRKREPPAQWWAVRPARSLKPATYRCPFCGRQLHAMSDHMLVAPEGDTSRRRHAHTECVRRARLVTYDEWRARQPRAAPWWRRLLGRDQRT